MKRALGLTLVLIMIFAGITVTFSNEVTAAGSEVTFTEKNVYGDIGAADGIGLRFSRECLRHLIWESTVSFADGEASFSTAYDFSEAESIHSGNYKPLGVTFGDGAGYIDWVLFDMLDEEKNRLAEGLAPGETAEEVLYLKDYFEYYPITFSVDTYGMSFYGDDPGTAYEQYVIERMTDFFRIPVLPDAGFVLHVGNSGSSWGISSWEPEDGDCWYSGSQSVMNADAVYFWFNNSTTKGNRVDTSLIPGGYGIYVLPMGWVKTDDHHGYGAYEGPDVFIDEMRVFYPLEPETDILRLDISSDGRHLILHTEDSGSRILTVINASTGETEKAMVLSGTFGPEEWTDSVSENGLILIMQQDGRSLHLIAEDAFGMPYVALETEPCEAELSDDFPVYVSWNTVSMAFDGERLILAGPAGETDLPYFYARNACGFYIAVYGNDGLMYYGKYSSSLDEANSGIGYNEEIRQGFSTTTDISFTE